MIMAESNPEDSISAWMDKAFVEKAEELSGGSITIQLNTDGILGDNSSVMQLMTKPGSNIHLARVSPATIVPYNCEKHTLLDIPFTFTSREHFWKFAFSPLAQTILNEPYEKKVGVKGLFFTEEGFRHFFATKRLEKISDFAGEKIRTAGNTIMHDIANVLGGEPVKVSFSDLYSALQTGIADVAEQPISNYLANHFNKIAPFMILDGHQLGIAEVIITSEAWDSLSENQQKILVEAGKYAGEYCSKISQEAENAAQLTLRNEGTEFIEVNDIAEWQNVCADVRTKAAEANSELYGEIVNLAK